MTLFPIDDLPVWPAWFTPGRTTPATHKGNVRAGRHPLGLPLLQPNTGQTCGNCRHRRRRTWNGPKVYQKCDLIKPTNGPGTDLRSKWAACNEWKAEE